jgi:hypothetical protein
MQALTEPIQKQSDELVKMDHILVAGVLCVIADIKVNHYGQYVLRCGIVGSKTKKRNMLTVIIPDKTLVTTSTFLR